MKNKRKNINRKNTIFYSTANDEYIKKSITSLLSVREHVPDAHLCVLCTNVSNKNKKLLKKYNISYKEIDLGDTFKDDVYPKECFYLFAGPELFYEDGYNYSIYLDGDVYFVSDPFVNFHNKGIEFISGTPAPGGENIFGNDWKIIKKTWGIKSEDRIQSGIIYFNNREMRKEKLLHKAEDLYKKCIEIGAPRRGDDSLFALMQSVYFLGKTSFLGNEYNYNQHYNKWTYPINGLVAMHFTISKPWQNQPYRHDKKELAVFDPYIKEWRKIYRKVDMVDYIKSAFSERIIRVIKKIFKTIKNEWLAFCGLKKHFLTRRRNQQKSPIRVYWANERANFGDLINGDIINSIFGYDITWCPGEFCNMICAGSIITFINGNRNYVWGSGLIEDGEPINNNMIYCAVRGKLTRKRIGQKWSKIPLGDPGLLANLVYDVSGKKNGKIGIIPHYIDYELGIIKKIRKDNRFCIINVEDHPSAIAEQISQCKLILSSSLHGLIFADSYSIPNAHIKLSDNVIGGRYKFKDYYSATGREYKDFNVKDIFNDESLQKAIDEYEPVKRLKTIQRKLIKAFPYK